MTDGLRHLLLLAFACAGLLARPGESPPVPGKPLPAAHAPAMAPRACPAVSVHFSPDGGCEAEVIGEIGEARRVIRMAAYSFTSGPIADALVAAHARGVDVAVVVDRSQPTARGNRVAELTAAGIPVSVDRRHGIFHDKYLAIDGAVVLTGSYNWTASAEHSNAENLATIRDAATAKAYGLNWAAHAQHSEPSGVGAKR